MHMHMHMNINAHMHIYFGSEEEEEKDEEARNGFDGILRIVCALNYMIIGSRTTNGPGLK